MLEKCNKICEKGNIILEKKRFYSSLLQAEKGGNKWIQISMQYDIQKKFLLYLCIININWFGV